MVVVNVDRALIFHIFFLWIALCVSFTVTVDTENLECRPDEYRLNGQRCCSVCPPGEGASHPCSAKDNTVCSPCIHGNSFSSSASHTEPCQACSTCPEFSRVVTSCNVTHDIVCECETGYFYDNLMKQCKQCDLCVAGYGVRRPCNRLQNTVCSKCQEGSYSDRKASTACTKCSTCGPSEVILQPCTGVQNTICVDIPYLSYDPSSGGHSTPASVKRKGKSQSTPDIIPILCVFLGLVVLGTIVWAIVKARRQRAKSSSQLKRTPSSVVDRREGHGPHGQVRPLVRGVAGDGHSPIRKGGIAMLPDSAAVTNLTRYEALPLARRYAVENMLQCSNDASLLLRKLAKELGKNTDIHWRRY